MGENGIDASPVSVIKYKADRENMRETEWDRGNEKMAEPAEHAEAEEKKIIGENLYRMN